MYLRCYVHVELVSGDGRRGGGRALVVAGRDVMVLEARDRMSGRILVLQQSAKGSISRPVVVGPSTDRIPAR
jgi:hypothetical protein